MMNQMVAWAVYHLVASRSESRGVRRKGLELFRSLPESFSWLPEGAITVWYYVSRLVAETLDFSGPPSSYIGCWSDPTFLSGCVWLIIVVN